MERKLNFLNNNIVIFILLIFLSLPALWALFVPGFYGASDDIHMAWLYEMEQTIKMGQIPPRYVPNLSFGFGYPLFNFVFPLPFYIGEIFYLVGFSLVDSIKSVFFISSLSSVFFMYLLLRQFLGKQLSLLGALVYLYTPYRAVDLYIRGAIGEIVAFTFLPLVLLSVIKLVQSEKINLRWIGIGGLTMGGLILSHNIATYMFVPFLLLFCLIFLILDFNQWRIKLINLSLFFVLSLLVSLYFWLPALVESNLMKYDTVFKPSDHFPTIKQLITPYWGYGASVAGPYDGLSFFLGATSLVIIVVGFLGGFFKFKKLSKLNQSLFIWGILSLLIVFFMMNFRSKFIWDTLPLIPYFQFPWRFLIMTTFIAPVLLIGLNNIKIKWYVLPAVVFILISSSFFMFRPQDFLGRTDDYYLQRYIPAPSVHPEYRLTQEEYLRLPKATENRPENLYPRVFDTKGKISVHELSPLSAVVNIKTDNSTVVNYNKYNFPGWRVEIDGQGLEIFSGKPFGQVSINIPSGEHEITISFAETGFRQATNIISLLSLMLLILIVFKPNVKKIWK